MIITPVLVLFLAIVFIPVFLFVKTIDKRKWISIPVSLLITPIIYFYLLYPTLNIFSDFHHEKYFKTETWKSKPQLRYEMFDNMVDSDMFIGKSKAEVTALLGTYEWLTWDDSTKDYNHDRWNYGMGLKPGALNEIKECAEIVFENDAVVKINTFTEQIVYDN